MMRLGSGPADFFSFLLSGTVTSPRPSTVILDGPRSRSPTLPSVHSADDGGLGLLDTPAAAAFPRRAPRLASPGGACPATQQPACGSELPSSAQSVPVSAASVLAPPSRRVMSDSEGAAMLLVS
jgi:hypothetical protein